MPKFFHFYNIFSFGLNNIPITLWIISSYKLINIRKIRRQFEFFTFSFVLILLLAMQILPQILKCCLEKNDFLTILTTICVFLYQYSFVCYHISIFKKEILKKEYLILSRTKKGKIIEYILIFMFVALGSFLSIRPVESIICFNGTFGIVINYFIPCKIFLYDLLIF